ncbi:Regulator of V-ATPase in vacuolar membrane protein 1 [Sphaceloma murrayae]|uniref:Regulator of V-ATPase in vacuolar membrane protein 1 n=1 Tax=Sphaceloma murrayae TaxID=2082308 RepID=A0A2K1QJI6_9PEZI|nr:Regulator of V-ATPase in vacuolar membrane protein 1 [Sphaceloma murrayae]
MQAILPGQPQAQLHGLDYGYHEGQLVVAYISGSSIVLLNGPHSILQTIDTGDQFGNELVAVKYHEASGRIAAASKSKVFTFGLREEVKGTLRWSQELVIACGSHHGEITTLSWGSDEELLVGGAQTLNLFNAAHDQPTSQTELTQTVWSRTISSRVSHADFSPSASLIATLSLYDCLVKIWRRLSFESPQFDYAYLRHPNTVTHIEWRREIERSGSHAHDDDVLFTICVDGKLRVWKSTNPHGTEILSLYADIDMAAALQPQNSLPFSDSQSRYAVVLPFSLIERVNENVGKGKAPKSSSRHAQEHFAEIMRRRPDIVVVADEHNHMSAWGLENVGCKRRSSGPAVEANPFHICSADNVNLAITSSARSEHANCRLITFLNPGCADQVTILAHHFDGRISWYQTSLTDLIIATTTCERLRRVAEWTGHTSPIKKIDRTTSGNALISRTDDDEGVVWKIRSNGSLARASKINIPRSVLNVVLLRDGDFLACLHPGELTLWDTRQLYATQIASSNFEESDGAVCLIVLPDQGVDPDMIHLVAIRADMAGRAWQLYLPSNSKAGKGVVTGSGRAGIRDFCSFELERLVGRAAICPVDPAGDASARHSSMVMSDRDIAMSYSDTGTIRTYTAKMSSDTAAVDFTTTSMTETGLLAPTLGGASFTGKAALVDSTKRRLTIWDIRGGRLDHDETFSTHIQDLGWTATPDGNAILAVHFSRHVMVYCQLRYDYVDDRPAWASIKTLQLPAYNLHPIGDSVWSTDGSLLIGAGIQLFKTSNMIDLRKDLPRELQASLSNGLSSHIYQVARRMNGPLPVFHPHFVSQCFLAGKSDIVYQILLKLLAVLRFYTDGDDLDPMLDFSTGAFVTGFGGETNVAVSQEGTNSVTRASVAISPETAASLTDLLAVKSVPQLTSSEQTSLGSIIDCVATTSIHSRSVDDNALRFLLFWRSSQLRSHQQPRASTPTLLRWREVVFAYHSTSQDILLSLVLASNNQALTWPLARHCRLFTFLTSREALLTHFETLAKSAYTLSDPRNPVDCSLHYLALRKKAVLVGLWRMATWSREQGATMKLLRNDFSDPRWKTAAKKNAFALMGKRRFEYAAAFFLLADDLKSALGVLANQLGDLELAIAVGRVYGGDECKEIRDLIMERVVKEGAKTGDRWMVCWGFWFLGEKAKAMRALMSPLDSLVDVEGDSHEALDVVDLRSKSFLNDDPTLVVMYEQLRGKSLQSPKKAWAIDGKGEWKFLIRTTDLLRRMGCDLLALDLVRNWKFMKTESHKSAEEEEAIQSQGESPGSPTVAGEEDSRKLLGRRSSSAADDLQEHKSLIPEKVASMLDGFGFNENYPAARQQDAKVPSMLDAFGSSNVEKSLQPGKVTPKARSLLDDFDVDGGALAQKADTKAPSVLDAFTDQEEAAAKKGDPTGHQTKEVKKVDKKEPAVWKEPDANSILDNFGF